MGNKLNIQVLGRKAASQFTCDVPWIAIQVSTYKDEFPKLNKVKNLGVLQLVFSDAEGANDDNVPMLASGDQITLFTKEMARNILDFVETHKEKVETILVHCEAGLCRSPAIAAALSKILYNDDKFFFINFLPNMLVYNTILKTHYE